MSENLKYFKYNVTKDSIAVVTLDLPGEKVNKFSNTVVKELKALIAELNSQKNLKGAILKSGKPGIFIAGADINELGSIKNLDHAREVITEGHNIFTDWSNLPFPTCAIIDGACMGGGLEFALSFDYRLVGENSKTVLAFPEVKLGIIPGWGGTQRFTRLVGAFHAIDYICSGRNIRAREAFDIGLADDFGPSGDLESRAIYLINREIASPTWPARREKLRDRLSLSQDQQLFTFGLARSYITGETKGHYPAPLVALDAIQEGHSHPINKGLEIEIEKVLPLTINEVSRNLINIFFMSEDLKKESGTEDSSIVPDDIHSVGILGAGIMGGGIATANINKGFPAILKDISEDRIKVGVDQAIKILGDRVKKSRMTQEEMYEKLAILSGTLSDSGFQSVDLVIEAVLEDLEVKKSVFRELEKHVPEDAILASNTSTISIDELSTAVTHPENFLGLHFFNPVHKMPLVEVIRGEKTSAKTVATAMNYARKIGKTPVVVNNGPGFLVNRVLLPYLNEATLLVEEGVEFEVLDKAMTRFGMPMGPITLLDVIGLDVSYKAGQVILKAFPDRVTDSRVIKALVDAKRLGQKNGLGFYQYPKGKSKGKPDPSVYETLKGLIKKDKVPSKEEITMRMVLPMIVEATRILEDGVALSVRDVDMAMIMGTGFPPFRGGLLRYADSLGIKEILNLCEKYQPLGKRFEASDMIKSMADSGKTFYPR